MLKDSYDIVVNLGGNCAPAMHLRRDGKRMFSLPFDWLYLKDDQPIRWLVKSLKENCADFARKENLELIGPGHPEYNDEDPDKVKYLDRLSGYRLIHHFNQTIETLGVYERFDAVLKRRMARFFDVLDRVNNALLVLNVSFPISDSLLVQLHEAFTKRFPSTHIDLQVLCFQGGKPFEDTSPAEGVHVRRIRREENIYDFKRTSLEWDFLDDVRLSEWQRCELQVAQGPQTCVQYLGLKVKKALLLILPYGFVRWVKQRRDRKAASQKA